MTRLCKEFNCLPWPGGLMQQPKSAVLRLDAALDANNRYQKYLQDTKKDE